MDAVRALFAAALAVASFGCSSPPPTATNPLEIDIVTPSYTVKAGEEKRYMCFTTRLPADRDTLVTQIEPIYGKATHHLGVYYTLADEPDGVFDCPELVKPGWIPLYGGGIKSGTLTAPEGAAFRVTKGQQILVQLHLLNSSGSVVTDKATIKITTTNDQNAIPAGVFGMTTTQIAIPPNSTGNAAMDCPLREPMNVFAVFGHMHQLGTHIALSETGGPMLYEEDWNFNDQPTVPKSFQLSAGASVHLDCQYDNTTAQTVTYGESSFNEMCSFVLYYSPYPHLDGCQK